MSMGVDCRRQFRGVTMVTTGSKFPSLYDSVRQIPYRHDTNLCPVPLIVILQTCNL